MTGDNCGTLVAGYALLGACDEGEAPDAQKGEKALWRAVVTQALMDAGSNSTKREMRLLQAHEISWLSGISPDFSEVCALADVNPDYVREKARDAIAKGCMWRKYNPNSFARPKGVVARRRMMHKQAASAVRDSASDSLYGCATKRFKLLKG